MACMVNRFTDFLSLNAIRGKCIFCADGVARESQSVLLHSRRRQKKTISGSSVRLELRPLLSDSWLPHKVAAAREPPPALIISGRRWKMTMSRSSVGLA
ncbi:hypothetical protein EVAR_68313_1 [Eumeta japonica]|uniref:Uncharacterized protein n=1 Tax=Eumeta variegata TaxID=151549 RepID=A0A4C2AAG0_EUMVA|nr:hypothetical protein EVAR_68313_1 [Eumeta japonica]